MATSRRSALVGNRWALAGAVIYLLEWVAIIAAHATQPPAKPEAMVAYYSARSIAYPLMATWFSLVLPGRILYVAGLRHALRRSGYESVLADMALAAMAVSVVIEVARYALSAAAAQVAHLGDVSAVIALDAGGHWLNAMVVIPFGVAVASAAAAQRQSRLFPAWLVWGGLASGLVVILDGFVGSLTLAGVTMPQILAVPNFAVPVAWIWMIATGVVLWLSLIHI